MFDVFVYLFVFFFFFKQKTAYEMRISDWSSDVCSSDLFILGRVAVARLERRRCDDRCDGEIAVGDRAFHALRQGDVADVDRIADVETGDVDRDVVGNLFRFADPSQLVAHAVQTAARLQGGLQFGRRGAVEGKVWLG